MIKCDLKYVFKMLIDLMDEILYFALMKVNEFIHINKDKR